MHFIFSLFIFWLSCFLTGPGEDVGAKVSLVEDTGPRSTLFTQPTFQNIQAAYEDGEEDVARELIQQACCVVCSAGTPRIDGVSITTCCVGYNHKYKISYASLDLVLQWYAGKYVPQLQINITYNK